MAEQAVRNMLYALQGIVNEECLVNKEVTKVRSLVKYMLSAS
ncbi:MAG: hypothetical protein ACP5LN_08730 [Thermoproteota archaeon]|jgi:hypothetical protein